jgi:mRNA interferase YafQ
MREPFYSAKFRRDFKRAIKRGRDMELLRKVMKDLENSIPLDPKYEEHALIGNYVGHTECHIQSDWVLIYVLTDNSVTFSRTGTHSDLFDY